MRDLAAGGVNAFYFEIDSELGHLASGPEYAEWSPVLRQFLEPLMSERR
jgi:homoserine O-acetyltransferase